MINQYCMCYWKIESLYIIGAPSNILLKMLFARDKTFLFFSKNKVLIIPDIVCPSIANVHIKCLLHLVYISVDYMIVIVRQPMWLSCDNKHTQSYTFSQTLFQTCLLPCIFWNTYCIYRDGTQKKCIKRSTGCS